MIKRAFFPFLALVLAGGLMAGKFQDSYLLRYELKPKSSDKYKMSMTMNMKMDAPGAPPSIDIKSTMDFELNTLDVGADGKADVEMKTTNIKMDTGDLPGGGEDAPKEMVIKAKMDDRYRLTDAKAGAGMDMTQMMMNMSGANQSMMMLELPENPIKVGDSWEFEMAKNPILGEKAHMLKATLKSLTEYEGTPAYEVELTGKIDLNVNLGEAMKKANEAAGAAGGAAAMFEGMDMTVKGQIGVAGKVYISRKSAKILASETTMDSKQAMEMMGMTINMDGVTKITMKSAN